MLTRRRFVTGLFGATVALPLLESIERVSGVRVGLGPATAHAQARMRPGFAVFVGASNGVAAQYGSEPERFWPATAPGPITTDMLRTGTNAQRAISELADYAPRMSLVHGLSLPFGRPRCGHSEAIVQVLTARNHSGGPSNEPLAFGESLDWRIARALNPMGRPPLTLMAGPRSAYIAEGLSWRGDRMREPAQRSPLQAYTNLMGLAAMPPDVQRRIAAARMSVNDLLRNEMGALLASPALGAADRARLQLHREAIRDTELRVACTADSMMETALRAITNPEDVNVRPEVVRRHMDVVALAFSCGLTHAATIQIGEGNDQTTYEWEGTRLPRFHWISHRIQGDGGDGSAPPIPNADVLHHQVDRIQMRMYKYLLDRLNSLPSVYTPGQTLLDDSAAVWLNNLGNGPPHSAENIPFIVTGGGAGGLRGGNYIRVTGTTRVNQVLNSIATGIGVRKPDGSNVDDFGDPSLTRGMITGMLTT